MYKFVNSSIKDYISTIDGQRELAASLKVVDPEYQDVYDAFTGSWKNALTVLDEEEKKLFALRYVHGYNQKDISDIVDILPESVSRKFSLIYYKLATYYKSGVELIFKDVV